MLRLVVLIFAVNFSTGASDADCNVVPMAQWSGGVSRREDQLPTLVSLVVVQHTVTMECMTDAECETRMKSIQKYHIEALGFTDVGYSFIIGGNGKVYECAGWNLIGAHTFGYNNRSIGIAFIGDFRDKLPTPEALKAAHDLLSCGVENKHLSEEYHLVGHGQLSATQSPGATLQSHLKTWPHWLANARKVLN